MARRLAFTVHVRVPGDEYRHEVFLRGEELPEWAVPLVGDHVYEPGEAPSSASPAPVVPVEAPVPAPEPNQPERPAGNASAEVWREYAVSLGAERGDVADLSRNELRDLYGND
jgi:hypothetical protein